MKWRLCSSGLYISITAPLSTSACSSVVRTSALVKLSGATLAAIVSKTLKCGFASLTSSLFMPSIRAAVAFLSAYFSISSNSANSKLRIADAHRGDGQRFIVHADEKLTAFLELELGDSPLTRDSGGHIACAEIELQTENSNQGEILCSLSFATTILIRRT